MSRTQEDWQADIREMIRDLDQTSDPPTDDELWGLIEQQTSDVSEWCERVEPTGENPSNAKVGLVQSLTALEMMDASD